MGIFDLRQRAPSGIREGIKIWPLGEWLLVGVATPLLFFPSNWSIVGILLIAVAWIIRKWATGSWRVSTSADPGIALILLMAIVGIMVSVDQALSLNRAMVLLLGWLLYESTIVTVAQVGLNERILLLFGLLGSLLAILGLTMTDWAVGVLIPVPTVYNYLPQINLNLPGSGVPHSGGLFNPRTVAGGASLLWPVNGILAMSGGGLPRWQRLLHGFTALLLIGLIFLTQSPQGILAFTASLMVLFFWKASKWVRRVLLGTSLIAGLVAIWISLYYTKVLLSFLAGRAGFGLVARFELWMRAMRMIETAPLTGIGLNNYSSIMDAFYPGYALGPEAHAHNLFLQMLTDLGILGLFGLLLFLAVITWVSISLLRTEQDQLIQSILIAVIATIAGWLAYGLLEALSLGHKPSIFLWGLLALPMAFAQRNHPVGWSKRLWLFSAVFTIFTTIMIWQTGYLSMNIATITAQQALLDKTFRPLVIEDALNSLDFAEERVGRQPHFYRLRALLYSKAEEPEAAIDAFRELAALELSQPLWWWAPAPYLSGQWPHEATNRSEQAAGLASIYQSWHIRFPDRVEPVALLAYTYADGMEDHSRAIDFIDRTLREGRVEQGILKEIRKYLTRRLNP